MARRPVVLAPTTASLSDELRVSSSTTALVKSLGRLSRSSLIDVVFQWLDEKNLHACHPHLAADDRDGGGGGGGEYGDDDTSPYPAADSIEDLKAVYGELRDRKGGKREVIDRILEGDWRHGMSLRQLAMADFRYIEDHPVGGHRWTALRLAPSTAAAAAVSETEAEAGESLQHPHKTDAELCNHLPRFHASTFLRSIQREISPLVKAHYHVHRSKTLPLTFVRIFVLDSPYQYPRQSPYVYTDNSRLIFLAFPDSTPYIYSSLFALPGAQGKSSGSTAHTTDTRTLRRLVMDAIPKALSRPQARYTVRPTSLTTKSLHTLLSLRGPWRTNSANGAFTIFADAVAEGDPLDPRLPQSVPLKGHHQKLGGSAAAEESQKENLPDAEHAKRQQQNRPRDKGLSDTEQSTALSKKRKRAALSRFGTAGQQAVAPPPTTPAAATQSDSSTQTEPVQGTTTTTTSAALDRLQVHLKDPPFPASATTTTTLPPEDPSDAAADDDHNEDNQHQTSIIPTTVSLTFSGTDVVAGLRRLAELGAIDASRMPSWMTGEEGVSSVAVRGGKRVRLKAEMGD